MNIKLPGKDIYLIDASDVFEIMQKILLRELKTGEGQKEFIWVLALNSESRLINIQLIDWHGPEEFSIHPVDVYKVPLMLEATAIILVHNHVEGIELEPTANDRNLTEKMQQAQEFYNITLLDHVIINEGDYYSFAESE